MNCSAVRLPRLDGIVPLSWLESRHLQTGVVALSIQREWHNEGGTHRDISTPPLQEPTNVCQKRQ